MRVSQSFKLVPNSSHSQRRGVAAVELAVLSPLLVFIVLITIDFGRFSKYSITVQNASRSGALYGSRWDIHNAASNQTDTAGIYNAAYADIQNNLENLQSGDVVIASLPTKDAEGNDAVSVTVTVTFRPLFQYSFANVFNYTGNTVPLTQTCVMRVRPPQ